MRNFSLGLIAGLLVGTVTPVAAATLVGGTGYLSGYSDIESELAECQSAVSELVDLCIAALRARGEA